MDHLMDYMTWRGDLSFRQAAFNDIDAIIFAAASYVDLDDSASGDDGCTLHELTTRLPQMDDTRKFPQQCLELVRVMGQTVRYSGITVRRFVNHIDHEHGIQFSAVVFDIPDGPRIVAFRGTDNTLAGWKEDFALSYESPVPSQTAATQYLDLAAEDGRRLIVTGHSKGGNLAAYAASHASWNTLSLIDGVYSLDGPGLDDETVASPGYAAVVPVLHSIVPSASVVGMLLNHHPNTVVVTSSEKSIEQHNLFTWGLNGPSLSTVDGTSHFSQALDDKLHNWLAATTPEKRQMFLESVFRILNASGATTTQDLTGKMPRSLQSAIHFAAEQDPEVRKELFDILGGLLGVIQKSAVSSVETYWGDRIASVRAALRSLRASQEGEKNNDHPANA